MIVKVIKGFNLNKFNDTMSKIELVWGIEAREVLAELEKDPWISERESIL